MDVQADCLAEWSSPEELKVLLGTVSRPLLLIGGGSNLLFTGDFNGTVLHSTIGTIDVVKEAADSVIVSAGAGVVWDDFVAYAVMHDWWGVENLSAIPGTVGASAVQNVGAYGAEAKDFIESVEAYDRKDHRHCTLSNSDCRFSYRHSLFKEQPGR